MMCDRTGGGRGGGGRGRRGRSLVAPTLHERAASASRPDGPRAWGSLLLLLLLARDSTSSVAMKSSRSFSLARGEASTCHGFVVAEEKVAPRQTSLRTAELVRRSELDDMPSRQTTMWPKKSQGSQPPTRPRPRPCDVGPRRKGTRRRHGDPFPTSLGSCSHFLSLLKLLRPPIIALSTQASPRS